jgi:polysaccharide pyruvyl transferase WcaK-like protein
MTNPRNLARIVRFNATKAIGKLLTRSYRFNRYASAVTDRREFLRRISERVLVVAAGRFHGVCFCMKLGVPFVSSNTPKIEGMLADAGLPGRALAITDLRLDEIRRRAAWSPADEENRRRYLAGAQERIAAMFDELARAVRDSPA